jgi:hypothetical protein
MNELGLELSNLFIDFHNFLFHIISIKPNTSPSKKFEGGVILIECTRENVVQD